MLSIQLLEWLLTSENCRDPNVVVIDFSSGSTNVNIANEEIDGRQGFEAYREIKIPSGKKRPLFSYNINSPHKVIFGWNIVDSFV